MSNLEGVVLSDYLLLQCISKGGVADVYCACQQEKGNHEVAIKVFRSSYAGKASFRDYFMLEAEKIGQFEHPHILPFLEYGEGEDLLYLVMPFITTGTLDDLLVRVGGRLPALQALPIVQQLCSAVQYAHDHNVIHGNIKPANVFVASDGRMLLTDFGIARGYDDSQQSLTRVGWGSAEYTAPEQSLGILHPSSDIYALGVLLFRLLTGTLPFSGQTPIEVLLKHVRQSPPSAREFVPTISEQVENVLRTALEKRAEKRFASAAELSEAFLEAVTVAPVASPFARPFNSSVPLSASVAATPNPQIALPMVSQPGVLDGPVTPIPPFIALSPPRAFLSLPGISDGVEPFLEPEAENVLPDSDVTEIRQKNFLQDDERKDLGQFWPSDPQEWSPIADPFLEEGPGEVSLTANEYLQSKPLTPDLPAMDPLVADAIVEKRRTRKWVPVLIVALLLLGLLGSLLSTLLFPVEKAQNVSPSIAVTATAVIKHRTTPKPSSSHTKVGDPVGAPVAITSTPIGARPTPKPGATPTIVVSSPVPTVSCRGGSLTLDGSSNFQPAVQRLTSDYSAQCASTTPGFSVNADGSKAGMDAVANGSSDLAYSDLVSSGRPGLVDNPLAGLTYAIIVSNDVGVTNLTTTQIQGIYTGSITNWSQVGGVNESITVLNRPADSAIRALFETYVLHGVAQSVGGTSLWFQSDTSDTIAQSILGRQGAISYVPLFSASANGVKTITINGVRPAIATVMSGAYPFWSVEHMYSSSKAAGLVQAFITFCATPAGQSDLAGYAAVAIGRIRPSVLSAHGSGPGI